MSPKRRGRGQRPRFYDELEVNERTYVRTRLEAALRWQGACLERDDLTLCYQPLVDTGLPKCR